MVEVTIFVLNLVTLFRCTMKPPLLRVEHSSVMLQDTVRVRLMDPRCENRT
jgi:hypothetical protein